MPVYTFNINCQNTKIWYKNNELHRNSDLPSVECYGGAKFWYKNGVYHRNGNSPAIEYSNGAKVWYKNGKLHRDNDLPAIDYNDGSKWWYKNDINYMPISYLIDIIVIKFKIVKIRNRWWYECYYHY